MNPFTAVIRFMERRRLTCAAFAAAAGCLLAAYTEGSFVIAICFAGFLAAGILIKRSGIQTLCACVCIALLFFGYYELKDKRPDSLPEGKFDLEGTICEVPLVQNDKGRTVITVSDVTLDGESFGYKVRIYIYSSDETYSYGDKLFISQTKLSIPDGQRNPGGFDFNAYLWRNGVALCGSSSDSKIEVLSETVSLKGILYSFRAYLSRVCDDVFSSESGLMKAVLLGDRSELDDETYDDFRQTGIAHVIALSGLHVSCIALLLRYLFSALGMRRRSISIITVALIATYTMMTGASASTVRAFLMYALYCLVLEHGYPADTLTRLSCAFLIQVLINPLVTGDTGFVLSYASIFAILCVNDITGDIFRLNSESRPIILMREAGVVSFSIQAVTFPILASEFFSIPLLSVPVNMLLVPFAMAALFAGVILLALGCIWSAGSAMLAFPVRFIWSLIRSITGYLSDLSFAVLQVKPWPVLLIIGFILLAFVVSPYIMSSMRRRRLLFSLMLVIILVVTVIPSTASDNLRITAVSCGYGDCFLIEAQGRTYLVDCAKDNGIAADYLSHMGYKLSGIFITHPDTDHCGGLGDVLKRQPYAQVYVPVLWDELDVTAATAEQLKGRDLTYLATGDIIHLSPDITAEVLWPAENYAPKDDNDGSLVLRICYGESSALFMADISDKTDINCSAQSTLLKVAHHGSKYATSAAMLEVVQPEIALISVDNNGFGHPTTDVLDRLDNAGAMIYRTDVNGAISVEMYRDGTYSVETFILTEAADEVS